jgi:hypothetical protein
MKPSNNSATDFITKFIIIYLYLYYLLIDVHPLIIGLRSPIEIEGTEYMSRAVSVECGTKFFVRFPKLCLTSGAPPPPVATQLPLLPHQPGSPPHNRACQQPWIEATHRRHRSLPPQPHVITSAPYIVATARLNTASPRRRSPSAASSFPTASHPSFPLLV